MPNRDSKWEKEYETPQRARIEHVKGFRHQETRVFPLMLLASMQ